MSKGFLYHIELYVSNLNRSIDFWGWFLDEMGYEPFQGGKAGGVGDWGRCTLFLYKPKQVS